MTSTGAPRRSKPSRRRYRKVVAVALTLATLTTGLVFGLLWWHFETTPPFAQHLATQPVTQAGFAARLAAGTVLADSGAWASGGMDPFALANDDPKSARNFLRCEFEVSHGDDALLHSVQELALAEERATGKRLGVAVRTPVLTVGEHVRAVARIYLHDADHLLEAGAGAVTFDVLFGAGDGRTEAAVVAAPLDALMALTVRDPRPRGMLENLLEPLWPHLAGRPVEGLLHHLRWSSALAWRPLPDGSQQPAPEPGELLHEANSYEYTFAIAARVTVRGANKEVTRKIGRQHHRSWRGLLW